jgi:hypothetical protein
MLKETITYFDFDGNERTESFYFNLTKAECMEMELSTSGGLEKSIQRIIEAKDNAQIVDTFKKIILKAYGEKSADGKHFFKSPEISNAFASTEAYSDLFMRLASSAEEATRFVNGIIPQVPEDAKKASDLKKAMIPGM